MKKWFVYILLCHDGTLYTGCTDDVEKRVQTHNQGKGAKYTRGRLPVSVVYLENDHSHSSALIRELQIKSLTKAEKKSLLLNHN
jgi:putative endonuclease